MATEFNVVRIEQAFEIAAPIAKVWDALVKQTPRWWPRDFCTNPKVKAFCIEPRIGGRAYEDWGKGEGHQWYQVIGVESPKYLCMLGQLSPQFGGPAMAMLTLRLTERDKKNTLLSLSDFTFGRADESLRQSTDGGWRVLFGGFKKFKADYSVIPWCTFIDPEVARVGLNEQEAREKGVAFEVTRYGIDDLDRAIADSAAHGWVKVLTEPGRDRILGVTIVGTHAGDLISEVCLAVEMGCEPTDIGKTIHPHPTLGESIGMTAEVFEGHCTDLPPQKKK